MSPLEARVRLAVYRCFLETSKSPSLADVSERAGESKETVAHALRSLAEQRCVVLEGVLEDVSDDEATLGATSSGDESTVSPVRMAMPFSARETAHAVRSGTFNGFANCAWDALGISVVTGEDAEISAICPVRGTEMRVLVEGADCISQDVSFVHFAVPAANWWDDIGFT